MIFLSARHPRRVSPQPSSWFNFLCIFVVAALCFSVELNLRPCFAARGFLVGLRGTCNAGVFFRSSWWHLAVSALSVCTPSSLPLRASCCSGLFCLISLALFVSPAPPSLAPAWSRMVFAWATVMDSRFFEYVVLESLGLRASWWILAWFFSSVVAVCWMLLLTSRCGQGFFPVARSSHPDIVPCIDGDDGASCAEAWWRVCLCSAFLTGPNGVIRLSLFLLAVVEIRGRFCAWAFPAWHAGPRVGARVDLVLSLPALCSVGSCPSFQVAVSLSPSSQGHNWNFRALVRFVGPCFFFGVSASRVKSKRDIRLWYLFHCCRFQRPCAWSVFPTCPSVVSGSRRCGCHVCFIEECMALFTAYSAQLWNRESFSLLVDWDDQQLLNAGLHLSGPRTVIFWYGSNRCQQLLLSAWLEVVVIYPVRFWIYSVSSRDFSVCLSGEEFWVDSVLCGVAAVSQLDTLHVAMMLLLSPRGSCCFLVSGSICDSSQLASSIHGLEFPIYWLCPNKNTYQKMKLAIKRREERKTNKKRWHIRQIMKNRRTKKR